MPLNPYNPLADKLKRLQAAVLAAKPVILQKMGTITLEFVDNNFRAGGFNDNPFEAWKPRKSKKDNAGRAILVKTGTLRRSFHSAVVGDTVTVFTNVPYAQIHNEGGSIHHAAREAILNFRGVKGGKLKLGKVRTMDQQRKIKELRRATIGAHDVNMPKRHFLGPSRVLDVRIETMIITEITKAFK